MTTAKDPARTLHRKLAQVMYEAERIPKRGKAPAAMGGFPFVEVGDAADFIRKALAEKVITMMPTHVVITGQTEHTTKNGGSMTTVDMIVDWTLTDGESGESITIQSFGAGADAGDKYSGKAQTNAMKYALLMGFLLSTGEDPELSDSSDRRPRRAAAPEPEPDTTTHDGGLIGVAAIGKGDADFQARMTPNGMRLAFRLTQGRKGYKVIAKDALAEALATLRATIEGERITVWGTLVDETFTPKDSDRPITYQVIHAERIQTADYTLPAPERATETPEPVEAESVPMLPLDDAERAAVAGSLA